MRKLFIFFALLLFAGTAFGQTLHKGGMIAVHETTLTLQPDVTMDQYLDFLTNKWYPEINKLLKGATIFGLAGDCGENERRHCYPGLL